MIVFAFLFGVCGMSLGARADIVTRARNTDDTAPIAAARPPAAATKESRVSIAVNMPLAKLETTVNQFQFVVHNKGVLAHLVSYDVQLTTGQIKVEPSGDGQFPIHLTVPFALKGTIAGSNIQESGDAALNLAVRVESDWCPIVEFSRPAVRLDDKPRPAAVTRSIPNFGDFVATNILSRELSTWTACDKLKASLGSVWRQYSITVNAPKKFYVNIRPRSFALSRVEVVGSNLRFVIAVGAQALIDTKIGNAAVGPLPPAASDPTPGSAANGDVDGAITLNLGVALP
ncbi:MAG TPA: hypothetical protein VFB45_20510 [Pseudolabrys sp.]|nr:hypothetical protein [Pseudolabrys sp.]